MDGKAREKKMLQENPVTDLRWRRLKSLAPLLLSVDSSSTMISLGVLTFFPRFRLGETAMQWIATEYELEDQQSSALTGDAFAAHCRSNSPGVIPGRKQNSWSQQGRHLLEVAANSGEEGFAAHCSRRMLRCFLKNPSGGSAERDCTHKRGGRGREVCQSILPYLGRYRQQGLGFGRDEPMRRNLKILTESFLRTF